MKELTAEYDIIFLQQSWILEFEIPDLANSSQDFNFRCTSAVTISDNVLKGCPHGGCAILWHKSISHVCNVYK